jgi:hypothetical protein
LKERLSYPLDSVDSFGVLENRAELLGKMFRVIGGNGFKVLKGFWFEFIEMRSDFREPRWFYCCDFSHE